MRPSSPLLVLVFALGLGGCSCGTTLPATHGDAGGNRDAGGSPDAAPGDGAVPHDAAVTDASVLHDASAGDAACLSSACEATERCYDGIDNDCNGQVDEGCACVPGTTARCLPGRMDPTLPLCSWGEMTCQGSGEFGTWGPCGGAGSSDGGSSLYGCRRIGIMGAPGANPSSNFQAWLETQGAIVTRFEDTASAPTLQRAVLETFDLVIVDWLQRDYTMAESTTLATWVQEGGGLMVMTGHDSGATADRQVSLLAAVGPSFDLAAGPLNGPATLLPHPTTVASDGTTTLPPVTFNGGLRTTVPASMTATIVPMAEIGTNIVGVAGPYGTGRLLLFGDEWIEFDSEWSTMPAIPQFWLDTVTWLAPERTSLPICE